jgi:hypothetical protein
MKNVDKLDHKPVDPLTLNEYTYSITNLKNEYQLWAVYEWWSLSYNSTPQRTETTQQSQTTSLPLIEKANAVWVIKANAMVIWNYNWKIIKINTWTTIYILAVPSIINWDILSTDIITMMTNKTLVYNNYSNLPDSYKNKWYSMTWWFDFIPQANILVYSWTVESLKDETNRTIFIDNLKKVYNNTVISLDPDFKQLIESDIVSNKLEAVKLANNIIENYVWKWIVPKTTTSTAQTTITESTDLWSLSDSDLKQIFSQTNSYYTSSWSWALNNCDSNNLTIDTTTFVPWNIWAKTLTWNTIYKIPNWTYNLIWATTANWHIDFWWNCIALVWQSKAWVSLTAAFTSGWNLFLIWIINMPSKSNSIITNLRIDWSKAMPNRYGNWIKLLGNTNNISINNVNIYNNGWGWITFEVWTNTNTISNLETYNNNGDWIFLNWSNNNNITGLKSYNNITGFEIRGNSTNNNIKNIEIFNNAYLWITLNSSSSNTFTNISSYNTYSGNSSGEWIKLESGSNYNVFNNVHVLNNANWWLQLITNSNYNTFNNLDIHNNWNVWITLNTSSNNYFNNSQIYSNFWWIYFISSSNSNTFNNISTYNNSSEWIDDSWWINNKYYWNLKIFWNWFNTFWSWLSAWTWSAIWWSNWIQDTTWTMSCAYHSQPNLVASWWVTCTDKRTKTVWLSMPITSKTYWASMANQIRPVKWNNAIANWELYWTDWIDYDSSKKVGEW